jgi:hypothetical protein
MADNFDLKKFLKESKALENLNPVVAKENLSEGDIRSKIREYIIAELGSNPSDYDYEEEDVYGDYEDDEMGYFPTMRGLEDEPMNDEIEEAKKKKEEEVEDVEVTDTETEDVPVEDVPAEEAPAADGGLEDIAANMEGTESELMQNLMDALKIAKGMGNEKLETQIGNTLKFFVSEYIGGGEE